MFVYMCMCQSLHLISDPLSLLNSYVGSTVLGARYTTLNLIQILTSTRVQLDQWCHDLTTCWGWKPSSHPSKTSHVPFVMREQITFAPPPGYNPLWCSSFLPPWAQGIPVSRLSSVGSSLHGSKGDFFYKNLKEIIMIPSFQLFHGFAAPFKK